MCKCTYITSADVFIPDESSIKNSKGEVMKGSEPTCKICKLRLSKRQRKMVKRKGYYRSNDPDRTDS